jgi:hypothetical protein
MRPREHGAYAMMAFPVLSGLIQGGASLPGVSFGILTVMGFLAHEPVMVLRGGRGGRVLESGTGPARRRLQHLALVALPFGSLFAVTAPLPAWPPAVATTLLALATGVLLFRGRSKTLPGELLVAATFGSVHTVLAVAGGAEVGRACPVSALWAVSFVLATLGIHALKYRFKGRGPGRGSTIAAPVVSGALLLGAPWAVALRHPVGWLAALLVPKSILVLWLSLGFVHPRHLKRVGWSLAALDTLTLGVWAILVR